MIMKLSRLALVSTALFIHPEVHPFFLSFFHSAQLFVHVNV